MYRIIFLMFIVFCCNNYCPPSIPIIKQKIPDYFKNGNIVYVDYGLKEYVQKSLNAWKLNLIVIETENNYNNKFHLIKKCDWWNGKTVKNDLYFNIYICKYDKNIQRTISHEISHALGLKHGYGSNIIDGCYDVDFPDEESLELIYY